MSLFTVSACLVLVLLLCASSFTSADCPNSCSGNGQCITVNGTGSTNCFCKEGYLSTDCSVTATMKAICYINNQLCSYWKVEAGKILYQRLVVNSNSGVQWAGVMWGATDGMAGGQSTILSFGTGGKSAAQAEEMVSVRKGMPTKLADNLQTINASQVNGQITANSLDISFIRLLDPGVAQHFVIPSSAGTTSTISFAFGNSYFSYHMTNRQFSSVDIAGLAGATERLTENQPAAAETKLASLHRRHTSKQSRF